MSFLKIGLFGIGLDTYWEQFAGLKQRLEGYLQEVHGQLAAIHPHIVNAGLVDTPDKAFEPGSLFQSARLDRGAAQLGFAVLTISAFWTLGQIVEGLLLRGQRDQLRRILGGIASSPDLSPVLQRMIEAQTQASSTGWVIALTLCTPVFAVVFLYLNAALTHAVAALLGQARRGFAATFAACAYACAPLVLLAVPACGSIIAVIWVIVLTSIGMKVTHGISTGAAAATVLAPYFVLCCVLFLAIGSLAMALRGAAGQP